MVEHAVFLFLGEVTSASVHQATLDIFVKFVSLCVPVPLSHSLFLLLSLSLFLSLTLSFSLSLSYSLSLFVSLLSPPISLYQYVHGSLEFTYSSKWITG